MKFQIMSTFWGEQHKEWFRRGCLKSLAFQKNREAILENCSTWNIYTNKMFFNELDELLKITFPGLKYALTPIENLRKYTDSLQSALVLQIEACLQSGDKFLFAPPDTIFANGLVPNILKLGREPKSCVAIAHVRVLPEMLDELVPNLSSPELVSLAWKHLHQSWYDAEINSPRQNSFIGGVKWEKLEDNVISVTHRLPTSYLADFTKEDLMYFQTCTGFGNWDHQFAINLYNQGRQRNIGGSEAGFIVELTERLKNIPPVKPGNPDDFWKNDQHNHINKQFNVILRGA